MTRASNILKRMEEKEALYTISFPKEETKTAYAILDTLGFGKSDLAVVKPGTFKTTMAPYTVDVIGKAFADKDINVIVKKA